MSLHMLGALLGSVPAPSLDAVRAGVDAIGRNMKGASVAWVQSIVGAKADGDFGPKTEDAVKHFQRTYKISPADGVVSKRTIDMMDKFAKGTAVAVVTKSGCGAIGASVAWWNFAIVMLAAFLLWQTGRMLYRFAFSKKRMAS